MEKLIKMIALFQELDKIVDYELKIGGVLLHPTFSGGKEKDKYTFMFNPHTANGVTQF